MSLPDTGDLSRNWCPECEPGADPTREILIVVWCEKHFPKQVGVDDERATTSGNSLVVRDVEGADNRAWCALLHRDAARYHSKERV